jgi:hypothetical protein
MAARTRASNSHPPGDRGNEEQDQPLTATVTATAAANRCHQRPTTAHNTRTIRANLGYSRPEKRTVEGMRVEVCVSSPEPAVGVSATPGTCQARL